MSSYGSLLISRGKDNVAISETAQSADMCICNCNLVKNTKVRSELKKRQQRKIRKDNDSHVVELAVEVIENY